MSKTRNRPNKIDNIESNESSLVNASSQDTVGNQMIQNVIWHDESNAGWTSTGVMSDRSSVYSIDDGDFDKEASRKVNNQLREIESILYEQNASSSSNQNECKEWLEKFPHLRILGKPIYQKDDYLTESVRSSVPNLQATFRALAANYNIQSSSSSNLAAIQENPIEKENQINNNVSQSFNSYKFFRRRDPSDLNNQNLHLNGIKMDIIKFSAAEITNKPEDFSSIEEEIIEEEGIYEELLAYDNQEEEHLSEQNKRLNLNKRRRHGIPAITPKASMKDLVFNFLFDHMWSELIDWSADTIKTYAKSISEEFLSNSVSKTPRLVANFERQEEDKEKFNQTPLVKENTLPPINISSFNKINSNNNNNNNNENTDNHSNSLYENQTTFNTDASNSILNASQVNISSVITRANIIHLKPFDSPTNSNFYPLLEKTAPNLLIKDSSNLYSANIINKISGNESGSDTLGELMTKDLLQIKQLNKNGNVKILNSASSSQSRVGSGSRRQSQLNVLKKRNSSSEFGSNSTQMDKNIIIHGAGLAKPCTLSQTNDNYSEKSAGNSFYPLGNITSAMSHNSSSLLNNRSSSAHVPNQATNSENENTYDNEYNDFNNFAENGENRIDEINILNNNRGQNNNGNNNFAYYNQGHFNYFGHYYHNHPGYVNQHQLPPIENSLISKVIKFK